MYDNFNLPSFNGSKRYKVILELHHFLDHAVVSGTNHTYSSTPCFVRFPICNDIFPIIDQCRFCYFWDSSWHSDECTQIALHSLFGQPKFYLMFILRKNKGFSLTENASFISLYGRTWSRYSEIILKETKTYLLKDNKGTLKNQASKATSCIRKLFASLDV